MSDNTSAQDRATDALLREYARLQQGDDEAFLSAFAQKLAMEPEPDAAPEIAPFVARRPQRHWGKKIAIWSSLGAAACAALLAGWHYTRESPAQLFAINMDALDRAVVVAPNSVTDRQTTSPLAEALKPSSPHPLSSLNNPYPSTPTSPSAPSKALAEITSTLPLPDALRLNGSNIVGTHAASAVFINGGILSEPTEHVIKSLGDSGLTHTNPSALGHVPDNLSGTLAGLTGHGVQRLGYDSYEHADLGGSEFLQPKTDSNAFSGSITNSGSVLTKSGAGTLTLGGASTYSGATSVNAGTLTISGTTSVNAGTLTISGGIVSPMPDNKPVGPGNAMPNAPLGNSTIKADSIDGLVIGSGGVSKTGVSTIVLNGGNTYTGDTTVSGGTLTFSNNGGRASPEGAKMPSAPLAPPSSKAAIISGGTLASISDLRRSRMQNQVSKAKTASPELPRSRTSIVQTSDAPANANRYEAAPINPFLAVISQPLSTFSIDVDTASYANIRRLIQSGASVPPAAVRIEEMINYFPYHYTEPTGEQPFSVKVESAACPWEPAHRLVKIALKAKDIDRSKRAAANLVFLVDVSGSMQGADRLQLVVENLRVLTSALTADDTVTIVTYAGNSGLALEPTSGSDKPTILAALDRLNAGGSTNGSGGIKLAYEMAQKRFIKEGINRVVLCTDGDFNVGITGKTSLTDLVAAKSKEGVFITVCGYGQGNLNDSMLEAITDKGNGVYHYIDSAREGRKVFQDDLLGTLITVAKDVKLQIEFNPVQAAQYRLIGYDNRMLAKEDFANDKVDAGDIGAGHRVTALYEVIPAGAPAAEGSPIPLKYQAAAPAPKEEITVAHQPANPELLTVKLRYKEPTETTSKLLEQPFTEDAKSKPSIDFEFATVVAEFGNILRGHQSEGRSLDQLIDTAEAARGDDPHGHRAEFIELMRRVAMQARDR